MPRIVELGGKENLATGYARVLDSQTNLLLVAIGESGIDVAVAFLEGYFDCMADLTAEFSC